MTLSLKERPIIFSSEMVKAILEDRKSQTRRVIGNISPGYPTFYTLPVTFGIGLFAADGKHKGSCLGLFDGEELILYGAKNFQTRGGLAWQHHEDHERVRCPYGKPGDHLWVRETFCPVRWGSYEPTGKIPSGPEGALIQFRADYPAGSIDYDGCWKPAIHMPRWASRLILKITKVRVERVQSISEEDADAEGVEHNHATKWPDGDPGVIHDVARRNYCDLWNRLNSKRNSGQYAWAKNPWVWVIEYKRAAA
jgi:hypothetical protein